MGSQEMEYFNHFLQANIPCHGVLRHKMFQFLLQAQAKILISPVPHPSWPFIVSIFTFYFSFYFSFKCFLPKYISPSKLIFYSFCLSSSNFFFFSNFNFNFHFFLMSRFFFLFSFFVYLLVLFPSNSSSSSFSFFFSIFVISSFLFLFLLLFLLHVFPFTFIFFLHCRHVFYVSNACRYCTIRPNTNRYFVFFLWVLQHPPINSKHIVNQIQLLHNQTQRTNAHFLGPPLGIGKLGQHLFSSLDENNSTTQHE